MTSSISFSDLRSAMRGRQPPIVIDVRSKANFEVWLKTQQALQQPADAPAPAVAVASTG